MTAEDASDALCEVVVDFLSPRVAESVEVRHRTGLAAEHESHILGDVRSSHCARVKDTSDELKGCARVPHPSIAKASSLTKTSRGLLA
eukprot:4833880-Pleurochrysis_carterae.AAC.6